MEQIKMIDAAIQETPTGDITVRGVISTASLPFIQVGEYQRETLPMGKISKIMEAIKANERIADVTLGCRGGDYKVDPKTGGLTLKDSVYVIDGLQRISAALFLIRNGDKTDVKLGATVYFNTTEEIENQMFTILNTLPTKLAPAILIRNLRDRNEAINVMYNITHDRRSVLYDRVAWGQGMKRHELITALILSKVVATLHSGFRPGGGTGYQGVANALQKVLREVMGKNVFRENIQTFFEAVDAAWGIRSVAFKQEAVHLRGAFLMSLAHLFAQHKNFWDDNHRLVIPADIRKKLSTFPIRDPYIRTLQGYGRAVREIIYGKLVEHLDSGKRSHRLIPFKEADRLMEVAVPPSDDTAAVA